MSRIKTRNTKRTRNVRTDTETVGGARQAVLAYLKQAGGGLVSDIAEHLQMSYEGARQHLAQLEKERLVERRLIRPARAVAGRPTARYVLSASGDHLFPKNYDGLTVELIDTVTEQLGVPVLKQVLGALTEKRVRTWAPRLEGRSLKERVALLREIYGDGDPYMSVEVDRDGIRLIERNCPFFNVASQRPALCSVTVSTLQRLLGVKVVREERFQAGDGRCVFRVLADEPIDTRRFRFALESDSTA
ncbi:MAG: ArsR family transcriptional regulator [Gammaproteobacteria bacterium]|nr:ArsR family transcriptional regulator [Gammaproteobacteria bacterium]